MRLSTVSTLQGVAAPPRRDRREATRATILALVVALFLAALGGIGFAEEINWPNTKEMVRTDFPEAPQLSVAGLVSSMNKAGPKPLLIDVREPDEYAVSHLPGAVHAQGKDIAALVKQAGPDRPVILYCSVGYRSSRETEKLRRAGFGNVVNLEGSIFEWANDGLPLVQGGPESEIATKAVHPFNEEWGALVEDADRRSYVPLAQ